MRAGLGFEFWHPGREKTGTPWGPGFLLPLCHKLTFPSGRGGPAWSLVLGNAGNEMSYPPAGEHMGHGVSTPDGPLTSELFTLHLHLLV